MEIGLVRLTAATRSMRYVGRPQAGLRELRSDLVHTHSLKADVGDRVGLVRIVGRLAPWKRQHILLDAFTRAFPK